MTSKKSGPSWQVVLEEIRSQNRSTIEAVEAARTALEERIERLGQETRSRDAVLELAIRQNTLDIRDLKSTVHDNGVDIRTLTSRVEALVRLEERVTALERRATS